MLDLSGVELEKGGVSEVWRNFAGKLGRIVPPIRREKPQSMTTPEGITGSSIPGRFDSSGTFERARGVGLVDMRIGLVARKSTSVRRIPTP